MILAIHYLKYIEDLDVYKIENSLGRKRYCRVEVIDKFMKDVSYLGEY